ncbi:MAG: RDD family protein [Opitutaceae bacterium]|nr:RDD family protein [Opitutaceae bacterium]
MFTIIGGDGREYGPATTDQIRSWITAGRANLDTKARAADTTEWKRLGDFAEFAPAGVPPPLAPPVAPATTPAAPSAPDPTLADRGTRLMARVIDWIIELVCAVPGLIVLGAEVFKIAMEASQGREPDFSQLDIPRLLLGAGLLLVFSLGLLVVQVWMLTVRGQTIGKRIVGIRVVKLDGSPCGFVNGWLMRELLITAIGVACSMIPFIGPILLRPAFHIVDWCLIFRDDQKCLHDQIATTKVVKV